MAMKTAVSIPDPLFRAAERLARRRGLRRSQLYAEALERLVGAERSDEDLLAQINLVVAGVDTAPDGFIREAAHQALARVEW
jgi:metal-responsive CopG/Arc/MetJ family transcriptional regulator